MTIFDYLKKNCEVAIYTDEYGNTYMETKEWEYEKIISGAIEISNKADDAIVWLIPKEVYEKHSEIEIAIAGDESVNPVRNVRRPYYRMRGVPVTAEQAFDIIRRTDRFLNFYVSAVRSHEDYIGCVNFENCLIQKNHYPTGYGWIRADGTIGANATTQKYPTVREFIEEWYKLLYAFPYLNLIIAVTGWNEGPWGDETVSEEEFCKEVAVGIYVHDMKIEILNPPNTIAKYKVYNKRYGTPPEKFEREYYEKHKYERYKTEQANPAYLRKCIEAYGLDADKILKRG